MGLWLMPKVVPIRKRKPSAIVTEVHEIFCLQPTLRGTECKLSVKYIVYVIDKNGEEGLWHLCHAHLNFLKRHKENEIYWGTKDD
jgi:hypothetical protein